MKRLLLAAAGLAVAAAFAAAPADAQHHYRNGHNQHHATSWHDHSDWRRGGYVSRNDYNRGVVVDYHHHRGLYRPPSGYEWRRVDNNYVLVAIASGLIASIIASNN